MKKRTIVKIVLLIVTLIIFLILTLFIINISSSQSGYQGNANTLDDEYLQSVFNMVKNNYVDDVSDEQLVESSLKGVFSNLDRYSTFFTKDQAKVYFSDISGEYCGIGILIDESDGKIVVQKVYAASPAEKAGLLPGDEVVSVDEKNVIGFSTDKVAGLIKGPADSKVTLGIVSTSEKDIKKIEVVRSDIAVNPVSFRISGNIGYIKIDSFNTNTENNLSNILKEMDEKHITKIILDLRNNMGGMGEQAAALANHFVPKGLIARVVTKSPDIKDVEYYSSLENVKYRLVVLVNGLTKSASELFSGAVQDTRAGKLIGTKTYGKARAQNTYPILTPSASEKYKNKYGAYFVNGNDLYQKFSVTPSEDEIAGYAKVTVGIFYTPKGRMIDKKGIIPDLIIPDPQKINEVDILNIQELSNKSVIEVHDKGVDVYNAESILKVSGYNLDAPDTELDVKTSQAIEKFQHDQNIKVDGILDYSTQAKLNELFDKIILKFDNQYAAGVKILNN